MIHRLDHPFRAVCAFFLTFWLLGLLSGFSGFGVGTPELALMAVLSLAVGWWAGRDGRPARRRTSD